MEGNPPALVPASSLESVGYAEQEFLVEGTARSFTLTGERAADGRWSVKEDATAPYVTRILVRRPVDPARFSGTVAVEWNNVSAGMDVSPVDVPTATLSGLGQGGEGFAVLAGRTDPFDRQTLERLYPGGRPDYLNLFANSLDATIEAGFLRPEDRAEILALAEASYVSAEESGSSA
jgi:hypothetical protein